MRENSLTPEEVAAILSITKNTVYEMVKRGELKAYRIGRKIRIDEKEIAAYKAKMRQQPAYSAGADNSAFIICGQDIILDILARYMETQNPGIKVLRSNKGSYNGLFDLYNGTAHAATAHLWDGESNTYNTAYVKYMLPGLAAKIIPLAQRYQGFYVKSGNPRNIVGWEDLKRDDITFVNREKGSGTRVLLDERLRLMGLNCGDIAGYNVIAASHILVATMVSRGAADFGLGIGKVAKQFKNIEFIPLQQERLDLVIKEEDLDKPATQSLLNIIASDEYKREITGLGGYFV
jgi:putative molybdopterin biosynthesis protein